jgi:hypothetical protein
MDGKEHADWVRMRAKLFREQWGKIEGRMKVRK